jgi:hypothetical protein
VQGDGLFEAEQGIGSSSGSKAIEDDVIQFEDVLIW